MGRGGEKGKGAGWGVEKGQIERRVKGAVCVCVWGGGGSSGGEEKGGGADNVFIMIAR